MTPEQQTESVLRVEFDFTIDDALAFNEYHFRHSPVQRRARLAYTLVPPAIWLGLALVFDAFDKGDPYHTFAVSFVAMSLVWILAAPRLLRRRIRQNVRRLYGEGQNKGLVGRHVCVMTADSVSDQCAGTRTETRWDTVERVAATSDHLFIYLSAVTAHVVPHRAFASPDEFAAFVAAAERWASSTITA